MDGTKKIEEVEKGQYWVKQTSNVTLVGCIEGTLQALEDLGKWFYEKTGHKLVVTAGTNGNHAQGEHSHANGWKLDVNDWFGEEGLQGGYLINEDDSPGSVCIDFINFGRSLGLGMNFEYDHIDICMDGTEWNEDNPGGIHNNGGYRG